MELQNKATSLWGNFFKLGMPQIRAFHMTWFSFFLCFLFKSVLDWQTALLVLGAVVVGCSFTALLVRFSPEAEIEASKAYQIALRQKRRDTAPQLEPALT